MNDGSPSNICSACKIQHSRKFNHCIRECLKSCIYVNKNYMYIYLIISYIQKYSRTIQKKLCNHAPLHKLKTEQYTELISALKQTNNNKNNTNVSADYPNMSPSIISIPALKQQLDSHSVNACFISLPCLIHRCLYRCFKPPWGGNIAGGPTLFEYILCINVKICLHGEKSTVKTQVMMFCTYSDTATVWEKAFLNIMHYP